MQGETGCLQMADECKCNAVSVNCRMENAVYILYLSQYWCMCTGRATYLRYRDMSATCGSVVCIFFTPITVQKHIILWYYLTVNTTISKINKPILVY
jgi:hypothetical protein